MPTLTRRLGDQQPADGQPCIVRFRPEGWPWKAIWRAATGTWEYPGGYAGQSYDGDLWEPDTPPAPGRPSG